MARLSVVSREGSSAIETDQQAD